MHWGQFRLDQLQFRLNQELVKFFGLLILEFRFKLVGSGSFENQYFNDES